MEHLGVQGYLATITSEAENTFVTTQLGNTSGAWLGGEQLPDSPEPGGGWQWITGEPWVYTKWDGGEPNNSYGGGWGTAIGSSEERLHYHHNGTRWNDLPGDPGVVTSRFIVEWDVPQGACLEPPSGMTGWWPGDESDSNGQSPDIVGGQDAELRGNATTGPGFVGDAFVLDGAGDFVEVPHDVSLDVGTGDFTVDFWVNFNTTAGEQVLVEKYVENFGSTPPGWFLTKLPDNSLRFGTGPASSGHGVTSPPLSLPANTWIHFAARRSSGVASIFVNGMQVATASFVDNADSDASLKFGHRGSPDDTPGSTDTRGFFLNGRIDEMELFVGRALTDEEIYDIATAGSAGKCKFPIEELTALSPATLWVGLKNSDAVGLRLDLQAEVFLNETKVGEGVLNNVASGSSGFNNAKLHEIPLTLFAPVEVSADAELEITLSVRRTCSGGGHNWGTPRLWYNGQPIDSGPTRDAGTRFGATIADTTSAFFLRDGFALSTTAGTAKKFVDVPVDNKTPCPNRPFTPFGTWSQALP
jgi:hypothetical protein